MKTSLLTLSVTAALAVQICAQTTPAPAQPPAKPAGSAGSAETVVSDVQTNVEQLAKAVENAKSKLEAAAKTPDERKQQLESMITTVKTALQEVSEGGKTYDLLEKAIATSQGKYDEYKKKMADPSKSPKTQEEYQRMAERFKGRLDGLYRGKMALNTSRAELAEALKVAEEKKELFSDLLLEQMLAEANQAVVELVNAMTKVSSSMNDMVSKISGRPDNAQPAP
ncbi:MAG: hypothetical protein ACAI34_13720 [Verrucomicrobium sp.]